MKSIALKELLGHSSVSITLDVYTSLFNTYRDSELENSNNYYKHTGILSEQDRSSEKDNTINFPILNDKKIICNSLDYEK